MFDDFFFADDQAYFAARVQLRFPQALASNKRLRGILQNGASVQADFREFGYFEAKSLGSFAYDSNLNACVGPFLEDAHNLRVGDFGIVNKQLFFSSLKESGQYLAGIHGTNHKCFETGSVGSAGTIRLKQLYCFLHNFGVAGDDSKAAAMVNIQMGKIERQHK